MTTLHTVIRRIAGAVVGVAAIAVIPLAATSGIASADPGAPGPFIIPGGGIGGPASGLGVLPGAGFGLPGPGIF
ncbi:MAG: hypothetical protein WBO08_13400 [Mycobacterium sp.]|nr:hypothetical protein [Mycobacterium sp.]